MKQAFIFVSIIAVAYCTASQDRTRSRSSARSSPRRQLSPILDGNCNVTKEEAMETFQKLFLVGDPKMLLPKEHCDIIEQCDQVEKLIKKKLDHLKCLKLGSLKFVFGQLAKNFARANRQRCSNKEWREKFLQFSDCIRDSPAAADLHQCFYKVHDAFQYSLDYIDRDHQLQFICCSIQYVDLCLQKQLTQDCGKRIADFAPELFWDPVREAFIHSCPGIESIAQCHKLYPRDMKEIDKIFASTKKLSQRNWMVPAYNVHHGQGTNLPEFLGAYENK